jgi:hypothetical protein
MAASHFVDHAATADATLPQLPYEADDAAREEQYSRIISRLQLLIEGSLLLKLCRRTICNWSGSLLRGPVVAR